MRRIAKFAVVGGGLIVIGSIRWIVDDIIPEWDILTAVVGVVLAVLWFSRAPKKFDRIWPKPRPGWEK